MNIISELNFFLDIADSSNNKVENIGQKVLHLNLKRKDRFVLNFIHKIKESLIVY